MTDTKEENTTKWMPKESNIKYIYAQPKQHKYSIIWLHGLGDHGGSWMKNFENFAKTIPDVKWIFPYVYY